MCICTPNKRTPICPHCPTDLLASKLPKVNYIPPMPPVKDPPLCDLQAFYESARENLDGYTFDKLVKKAQQK